jgi:hypothetical protein
MRRRKVRVKRIPRTRKPRKTETLKAKRKKQER